MCARHPLGTLLIGSSHYLSAIVPACPAAKPEETQPPSVDNGVHEAVRRDPRAQAQIVAFLQAGGAVTDTCGGPCSPPQ